MLKLYLISFYGLGFECSSFIADVELVRMSGKISIGVSERPNQGKRKKILKPRQMSRTKWCVCVLSASYCLCYHEIVRVSRIRRSMRHHLPCCRTWRQIYPSRAD